MRLVSKSSNNTSTTSRDGCSRRTNIITIVVLAAGRSSRFGSNKLLRDLGGDTLLARALRACGSYPAVVVTSRDMAELVEAAGRSVIINDEPDRGMAHSLRLANAHISRDEAIAVLPADLLHVDAVRLARVVEQARGADVAFPVRNDGTPGHPVVFSAKARRFIGELPDGDTLRLLRERQGLARHKIAIDEDWPYRDVDVESDLPSV